MGKESSVSLFLLSLTPSSAPIPPVQGFAVTQHSWEPHRTGGWMAPRSCYHQINVSCNPNHWAGWKWRDCSAQMSLAPSSSQNDFSPWKTELSCTFLTHQVSHGTSLCYYPLFYQGCWQWVTTTHLLCSSSKSSLIKPGKCYWEIKQCPLHITIVICFRSQLGFIRYQSLKATFKQPSLPPSSK